MTNQVIFTNTTVFKLAAEQSQPRVNNVLGQIRKSITGREAYELNARTDGLSKDFENVRKLDNQTVARFFLAIGINPEGFINGVELSDAEFERKSGLPSEARTRNQKGYKKTLEAAGYFLHGNRLENVLKTFVACAIIASKYHVTIPRDVCTRFLDSLSIPHVSDELRETLDQYRAKHMTEGAPTQTSQCTLQLATMRAASVVKNGRRKDFALDLDSPVTESFAQRFGLTKELEQAREYRASAQAAI